MPSPWVDLLQLHGHITDLSLLRRLAGLPPAAPRPASDTHQTPVTRAKRVIARWRLCLGIGDGVLRTQ